MNLSSIFRRENLTICVEVGKEVAEVVADGKVTIRECLDSSEDVAQCVLTAYGKADEVIYTPTEQHEDMAARIKTELEAIERRVLVAMENGVTYSEAVAVVGDASKRVASLITDIDRPIGDEA